MGYRTLDIGGVKFEYVIGKTSTKVKGLSVFQNKDIGAKVPVYRYCECCGETNEPPVTKLKVGPKEVANAIGHILAKRMQKQG